ncbi:putative proton-dependent oligopeptide transporter family, MFS transporter superfamily [Helianthus annuus]|nr:putative proton-dependent oligopeptide transporter family, MFS transporter superfamily [Helianthus annuus]KAJ0684636.1 putative proton-dependent oligopeptide transporter family, MFS transporter superfamily [Helianthus annuus]KAJ0688580.1 putative proton-dependent oligopeptide transporter family, MFS transporter superfamily [Helianthus annuus]
MSFRNISGGGGGKVSASHPSIVAFVFGHSLYRNMDPSGSPFTRLVQVCVAAYKKRNLPVVSDAKMLYENEEHDASISVAGRLLHTKQMK